MTNILSGIVQLHIVYLYIVEMNLLPSHNRIKFIPTVGGNVSLLCHAGMSYSRVTHM